MVSLKICLLGCGGSGKSCIAIRACAGFFVEEQDPTSEESLRKQVLLRGVPRVIEVLDTAGQEDFYHLRDRWIRSCNAFAFIFSLTDRRSFQDLPQQFDQVARVKDLFVRDIPGIIVANKADLVSALEVTSEELQQFATEVGLPSIQVSARSGLNVEEMLLTVTEQALQALPSVPRHSNHHHQRKCSLQ
jgi:GTPase KRas